MLLLQANESSAAASTVVPWFQHGAWTVGGFILALVGIGIAVYIAKQQSKMTKDLSERVFGTLADFDHVYARARQLLKEANSHDGSEVGVMIYWLWFGVDRKVRDDDKLALDGVGPEHSEIFTELLERAGRNARTTVVIYDPTSARQNLKDFVVTVLKYQTKRDYSNDGNLDTMLDNYARSVDTIKNLASVKNAKFGGPKLRPSIPMLMFAAKNGVTSQGIVYLGETAALKDGARTGGFLTQDRKLVDVIMDQIKQEAARAGAPAVVAPAGP